MRASNRSFYLIIRYVPYCFLVIFAELTYAPAFKTAECVIHLCCDCDIDKTRNLGNCEVMLILVARVEKVY